MTDVVVQLGGVNVERIMSMSLRLAVRELADTVQVEIIDDRRVTDVSVGESFAVAIRGRIVFVGEVLTMQRGARADSFSITALSSVARMVKSSIIIGDSVTSRVFVNRSLRQIIEQVVAPFDLVIDVAAGLAIVDEPIDRVRIKRHEMAFDFCARVAKRQGCILVSGAASVTADRKAKASIRICRNADRTAPFAIVRPHPRIQDINYEIDARAIHSAIVVTRKSKGRKKQGGTLEAAGTPAYDPSVRYSPLLVDAEAGARTEGELSRQAEWEVRRRRAEGIRINVEMDGWFPNDSQALWWPNLLCPIEDRVEGFADTMLLTAVTLTLDNNGGEQAALEFALPDAYAVLDDATLDGGEDGTDGNRRKAYGNNRYRANPEWLRQHSRVVTEIADASDVVDFDEAKLELIYKPPEGA